MQSNTKSQKRQTATTRKQSNLKGIGGFHFSFPLNQPTKVPSRNSQGRRLERGFSCKIRPRAKPQHGRPSFFPLNHPQVHSCQINIPNRAAFSLLLPFRTSFYPDKKRKKMRHPFRTQQRNTTTPPPHPSSGERRALSASLGSKARRTQRKALQDALTRLATHGTRL